MKMQSKYKNIILNETDPYQIYRRCIAEMSAEGLETDYEFTENIVYATEISYALHYLKEGRPNSFLNFADLEGNADKKLFSIIDKTNGSNVAFVGSGPFPVSAFQIRDQYPNHKIVCIDNNIVAHLIGKALNEKFNMGMDFEWNEAIDVDYENFNIVIIAAMVNNKNELVQKILDTTNSLIIVRGSVDKDHPRVIQFNSNFKESGAITFS